MTTAEHSTVAEPSAVAEQTFAKLEQAWNDANGTAFGAAFADDADFIDIRGRHHRGRAAISAGHQALFDTLYTGSAIHYRLESARLIAPECLVAVAGASLETPRGPAAGTHHARLTATLTRHHATWSIATFHNALVQAHT